MVVTTERLQTEERRARVFVEQEWAGVLAGLRAGVRVLAGRSARPRWPMGPAVDATLFFSCSKNMILSPEFVFF